jgi:pyridoxine 5-phosphate synthase
MDVNPHQVTLVPDEEGQITSDHGWDTVKHKEYLRETIAQFKSKGIRVSIFVDANTTMIKGAANTGTDRIELYTEEYARLYPTEKENVILKFSEAAKEAHKLGLGVNAGHDLNLENLRYFKSHIPELKEVSIGHALISDALYFGLENTIQMYLRQLQ